MKMLKILLFGLSVTTAFLPAVQAMNQGCISQRLHKHIVSEQLNEIQANIQKIENKFGKLIERFEHHKNDKAKLELVLTEMAKHFEGSLQSYVAGAIVKLYNYKTEMTKKYSYHAQWCPERTSQLVKRVELLIKQLCRIDSFLYTHPLRYNQEFKETREQDTGTSDTTVWKPAIDPRPMYVLLGTCAVIATGGACLLKKAWDTGFGPDINSKLECGALGAIGCVLALIGGAPLAIAYTIATS